MNVRGLTPILNVSDIEASFQWFEAIGWKRLWRWEEDGGFGAVGCGHVEVFLCQGAQGSRGERRPRFAGDDETDGVWMSWWDNTPWADPDRPGIRLFWASVLVSVMVILALLVDKLA